MSDVTPLDFLNANFDFASRRIATHKSCNLFEAKKPRAWPRGERFVVRTSPLWQMWRHIHL